MTHPFHPLCGQDFEFVAYRQNWDEDRVHLHDEDGQLFSLPAAWTDTVAADPFVVVAAGRAPFSTAGLCQPCGAGRCSTRASRRAAAAPGRRRLPARAWQRMSAGPGAKGPRWYDWVLIEVTGRP